MSNPSHRKTLARRLAAAQGIGYQQARQQVDAAADAGHLPARLDTAGMAAALRILTTPPAPASSNTATLDLGSPAVVEVAEQIACPTCRTRASRCRVVTRAGAADGMHDARLEVALRILTASGPVVHLLTGTGGVGATKCGLAITQENLAATPYTINPDEVTCPVCNGEDTVQADLLRMVQETDLGGAPLSDARILFAANNPGDAEGNPAYPNGRCRACGFGVDEQGRCYNRDCSAFDETSPYAEAVPPGCLLCGGPVDADGFCVADCTESDGTEDDSAPERTEAADAQGLLPFQYRYVAYFTRTDVDWFAQNRNLGAEAAKGAAVDEILAYCAPLNPSIIGTVEEVPFRGTDLENYASLPEEIDDTCFRLVFGGTVRAEHSTPDTYGGRADWPTSAQAAVDARSWENGADHGWDIGFAVFLDIAEPGQMPPAHRPTSTD